MAEYHVSPAEAVWDFPLALAMVLLPARNERHGGDTGPSYVSEASIRARNKARRFFEKYYTITKKPLSEVGWQLI